MREVKDSHEPWIGLIPLNWNVVKIKYIASLSGEHADNNDDYLGMENIESWTGNLIKTGATAEGDTLRIQPGQILFGKLRPYLAKVYLVENKGCCSGEFLVFNPQKINSQFFRYGLSTTTFVNRVDVSTYGTKMPRTNAAFVTNLLFPVPPSNRQVEIVAFLDDRCAKIDEAIKCCKKMNDKLDEYRKAVITKAVTKGVRGEREMKESDVLWIDKIPKEWSYKPLKTIFNFGKGLSITKANLVETGFPVISYGQVHAKYNTGVSVRDELIRFVDESLISDSSIVRQNDFIFADTSEDLEGCGNSVYIDTKFPIYGGYHTIVLTSKTTQNNKFIAYLVKTDAWRYQIRRKLTEVKLYSVSQSVLKDTTVILPPADEQSEIVSFLDKRCAEIDSAKEKNEAIIKKLEEYKKSLIYHAVTGKIEC